MDMNKVLKSLKRVRVFVLKGVKEGEILWGEELKTAKLATDLWHIINGSRGWVEGMNMWTSASMGATIEGHIPLKELVLAGVL